MHIHSIIVVGWLVAVNAAISAGTENELGKKIVAFCEIQRKEMVGRGECADLAVAALKDAGAKPSSGHDPNDGDYVWGKLILVAEAGMKGPKLDGKPADIAPGDIIQFRDAVFRGKLIINAPHHTAVICKVVSKGQELRVLEQNAAGKRFVTEQTYRLRELKEGWIRVYRPEAAE
jgi:hypothetical protein